MTTEAAIPPLPSPHDNSFITIGVDAGLRYTGLAWKEKGRYKTTQVENNEKEFALIPQIGAEAVVREIKRIAGKKKVYLVIEDFAFGGSFNTQQGELIGALKLIILRDRQFIGASFVAPNTAKKTVAGNGRATKGKVKSAAQTISSQKLPSSHVADAVAILYTYQQVYDSPSSSMYRRAIIKSQGKRNEERSSNSAPRLRDDSH